MKKKVIVCLAISAIIMFLPGLAVAFLDGDAGMAACLLLFFGVVPACSVTVGAFAGKDIRRLWSMPIILALAFLFGAWMFFEMGETAFVMYAVIYLVFGLVSMLISWLIGKK